MASDIKFEPEQMKLVAWGRPDSPRRPFCGRCHAHIDDDEVPLMLWRDDGSAVSLCDACVERMLVKS